jgi:hypothetical protein
VAAIVSQNRSPAFKADRTELPASEAR